MNEIRLSLFIVLTLLSAAAFPQKPTKPAAKPAIHKPFKFKTQLGKNDKDATVPLDEALQLVNFPLRVTDATNDRCTIVSYHFMYKRKSLVENEETGKKEIVFSTVGDTFKQTPLPQTWRDNLVEALKKDEELYFFDIIAVDKYGRKTFAPDLKIKIE